MQNKLLKSNALLLFIFGLTALHAQETIPAAGGNASGSGGSVSYSVGQLVYNTNGGSNGSVAQGVQQPYEISVVTSIEEATDIDLVCSAYPNPATEYLTLNIQNYHNVKVSYQLCDFDGKILVHKKIEGNETNLYIGDLVPSTYFLRIIKNNKEIRTFKIVKH